VGPPSEPAEPVKSRQDKVFEAAIALFDKNGFEKTTTDELAEAVGVTKRTLYRYIHSKQQLLFDVHSRLLNDMQASVGTFVGSPRERFAAVVAAHIHMAAERHQEIGVLYEEGKHLDPGQSTEMRRARSRYERAAEQIFLEAIAAGEFVPIDAGLATRAILGAVGEFYHWLRPDGRLSVPEVSTCVLTTLLGGISAAEWSPPREMPSLEVRSTPHTDSPMDRLISAAAHLFRKSGYQGTNTGDIAQAAGTTKGALFYHAGTKEELLVGIHEQLVDLQLSGITAIDASTLPAGDALHHAIRVHQELIHDHGDAFAVSMEEIKFLPRDLQKASTDSQRAYEDRLRALLTHGVETGEFVIGDLTVVVRTILGMVNSTYRWYEPNGPLSPTDLADFYSSLILNGVAVRKTATPRRQ